MLFQCEEDLCCPVCHDVFKDPVVLTCSHSFCRVCLSAWWSRSSDLDCPVCRRRSSRSQPPSNLALKNLCEGLLWGRGHSSAAASEALCLLHGEKLKLFCLEDRRPICLVCRDASGHAGHCFRPIQEEVGERRRELEEALAPLKDTLRRLQHLRGNYQLAATHIQQQAEQTEEVIREQFQKLHRFLEEDEEARIGSLREEEQRKRRLMEEKLEALSRNMADLSQTIASCEEELRAADHVSFLQSCKAAVQRVQRCLLPEEPPLPSHALIDQAQHLGNLAFHIWSSMKDAIRYTPLVLDPNTANPALVLSEDLTAVHHGERRKLPENPERMDYHRSVRARHACDSGAHSWDVEVGDNAAWFVGVAAEAVQEDGRRVKSGFWQLEFYNGRYSVRTLGAPSSPLRLKKKLQRIRVQLDRSRAKLWFLDPDARTLLHTFSLPPSEPLFPCMGTLEETPLKVQPNRISVTREQLS